MCVRSKNNRRRAGKLGVVSCGHTGEEVMLEPHLSGIRASSMQVSGEEPPAGHW